MKTMKPTCCVLLLTLVTQAASAQRLPLPDADGRVVQVFDLGRRPEGPALRLEVPGEPAAPQPDLAARTSQLLSAFVTPPLGRGDDLRVLADRWVVLVGSADQAASLDRLFTAARRRANLTIEVELSVLQVSQAAFAATWREQLTPVEGSAGKRLQKVFAGEAVEPLLRALAGSAIEQLECPKLTVRPLQAALMSTFDRTAYVKDFAIVTRDGKAIADPIVDHVDDGMRLGLCATVLSDGEIGLTADLEWLELKRPIPAFTSKEATTGMTLQIQLPQVSGMRLQQTVAIADGGLVVQAAEKANGDWLMTTLRAVTREQ